MKNKKYKCLIIYNPFSGMGINQNLIDQYTKILESKNFSVDWGITKYSNHATKIVSKAEEYDVVFSIGGDGTLNEVVRGNYYRKNKLILCPLPNGTCNDVASMLGYGKNPVDNINLALNGEIHNIDIGTINDNPFIYVAGMGKFMNIPYETKKEIKKKLGYFAYLKEGIPELFNRIKNYSAEIVVDGITMIDKYSLIMISNSNHIAGINKFYKDVCLDDGEMELLLCKSDNKINFFKNFLKFFSNKNTNEIMSFKAHDIFIKLLDDIDKNWCIDGEKLDDVSDEYHIKVDSKMKILTPKLKDKNLFKK